MIERGDVFRTQLSLPDRATEESTGFRTKYVVALQGGPNFQKQTDLAVVIASTLRRTGQRPFEVIVGATDGFAHDTVIDCRWVYTLLKSDLPSQPQFGLSPIVMEKVSLALVVGLQIA